MVVWFVLVNVLGTPVVTEN